MVENINIYIIIIIISIVYIFSENTSGKIYNKLLHGFYEADTSFCEESSIDTFCIYIDDKVNEEGVFPCYILMKSDDELIINEPTTIKISQNWSWGSYDPTKPIYFDVEFDNSEETDEIFPNKQKLRFYPNVGKIVLYNDDTVYGVLYKNGSTTELKNIQEE
jgi:hypothetical protein